MLQKLLRREEGVTAIEYALIAALIAVVIVTAVALVGTSVQATFNNVAGAICVSVPVLGSGVRLWGQATPKTIPQSE